MSWQDDKRWSDKFIPQIKRILGEHLIAVADWKQDATEASDLVVLACNPFRVGCRIRRNKYLTEDYQDEFTIRCERKNNDTELAKIMSGWGDYFFYGFEGSSGLTVVNWFIGDLKIFRLHLWRNRQLLGSQHVRSNGDESSSFAVWNRSAFPPEFVKAFGDRPIAPRELKFA